MLTKQTLWRPLSTILAALSFVFIAAVSIGPDSARSESKAQASAAKRAPAKATKKRRKPRAMPGLKLSHRHVMVGQAIRLGGRVRHAGRRPLKVVVKGPRATVVRTTTSKRGRYRKHWRPKKPGIYRLRAYVGRNAHARGGAGTRRTVTVYRPAHASWYGPGFYGNRTACGSILTSGTLGVAHKTLPCGTKLKLRKGKRRVTVRVIDRGPFIPGREFDLTYATKKRLGFGDLGTIYASR